MMGHLRSIAIGLGLILAPPALAQDEPATAELIREHLYAGTIAQGIEALTPGAEEGESAAQFGLGMMTLARGLETFIAAHIRHGFDPVGGVGRIPFIGVDIPHTEPPMPAEPIDYDTWRGILADFVIALDDAREIFAVASAGDSFVVHFDVASIRLDFDGSGTIEKHESIGALLAGAAGSAATVAPFVGMDVSDRIPTLAFGFDNADAAWLAGYSDILAVQADFLLAHDFSRTFDALFHRFFPRAGLPLGEIADERSGGIVFDGDTDRLVADVIGAIHTLGWPVVDEERFAGLPDRLRGIFEASRNNWALIRAETDDDAELLPGPHQTPPEGAPAITEEIIEAWHATLDAAEQVLDGELLIPHWRFEDRGFDLAAYFAEATRTDLVMLLTGLDALPYLREGKTADAESFADAINVFGRDFFGFALWFN